MNEWERSDVVTFNNKIKNCIEKKDLKNKESEEKIFLKTKKRLYRQVFMVLKKDAMIIWLQTNK